MKITDFRTDVLPMKDKLFRLALRITLDRQEAEDITQETLIRIWEQRDLWHQIENMEAYGLTICRRLALDYVRKEQLKVEKERDVAEYQCFMADDNGEGDDRMEAVRILMDKLPEVQRTVMLLRDIEGYRYDEIADMTSLTETQVKVYLHRARTQVKEALTGRSM